MGEAHSISLTSGETPAAAPDAPDIKTTSSTPMSVSLPTDQEGEVESGEEPSTTEEIESGPRPEWLPEKFKDAESMAQAYKELEGRLGQPKESEEPEEASGQPGVGAETLQPFYEEFADTGSLKDSSFAELEKLGLQRELVQAFMEGQKATHEAELVKIYDAAGGQDSYKAALEWAVSALPEEEINAFNEQVETGDAAVAKMAVMGMMARYTQSGFSNGRQPRLLDSEPIGPGGPVAYESLEQVMTDMRSDLYKRDSAFRAKVKDKLARSTVIG